MMILFALVLALILDALLSEPPDRWHPVAAMGSFIRRMSGHSPVGSSFSQLMYGAFLMIMGITVFSTPLVFLDVLLRPYPWLTVFVHAILLKAVFSLRGLLEAGRIVERALEKGDLPDARAAMGRHLVSRDTDNLGTGHGASAVIESLAENLGDSFVAPLLAYAIGGLPLAWAYRFVNTADAMIGYRDEKHEYLGKCAARLDDLLNWIPARVSGMLIVSGAPFVSGNIRGAWRVMISQHVRTDSPNAGWPMGAAAGALGVTLEKIPQYRLAGGPDLPGVASIRQARHLVTAAAAVGIVGLVLTCLGIA